MKKNRISGVMAVLLVLLAGCAGLHADESSTVEIPKTVELNSGDSNSMNYTPWYIHKFSISGPKGTRIGGGGGNMLPMDEDGNPGESGGQCCMRYPMEWQADLRVTVRWLVDKKNKKTSGWYKAENVRIPQYDGSRSGAYGRYFCLAIGSNSWWLMATPMVAIRWQYVRETTILMWHRVFPTKSGIMSIRRA
ncbi:DUF3304 domain-containing protein [Burkholderia multivorans]|uniref:DUF3304 domain-containing protein n=1 Tax=Burkholderia multivorans TaxID=87883 RepID=UPI0020B360BA|nr:DUF3304 domain-containing protein [Burkholderia multivorans]